MRTIVKFFPNPQEDQREAIPFISRTMCKLAIVSKDYKGIEQLPQEPTFFWVRIQSVSLSASSGGSMAYSKWSTRPSSSLPDQYR